jgi:hypothetical protein
MSTDLSENPFASPQTAADEGSPFSTQPASLEYEFEDASGRASAAIWCLRICAGIGALGIVGNFMQLALLSRMAGGSFTDEEVASNDLRQGGVAFLYLLALIVTAIFFCRWVVRSHKNIRSFTGGPFRFTPGWAAYYFFAPFLNLIRPYQAMLELREGSSSVNSQPTRAVGLWWTAWIIMNVWSNISQRIMAGAQQIPELRDGTIFDIVDFCLMMLAAWLAIRVIRLINNEQTERAQELGLLRLDV